MNEESDLRIRMDEMALTIKNIQNMVLQMKREIDCERNSRPEYNSTEYYLQMLKRGCQSYEQYLDTSLATIRNLSGNAEIAEMEERIFSRPKRAKRKLSPDEIPSDFPIINKPSRKQYPTLYIPDDQSTLNFPTAESVDKFNETKLMKLASQKSLESDSALVTETETQQSSVSSSAVGTDSIEHSSPQEKDDESVVIDDTHQNDASSSELDEAELSQMLPRSGFILGQTRTEEDPAHLEQSENPYAQLGAISRLPKL